MSVQEYWEQFCDYKSNFGSPVYFEECGEKKIEEGNWGDLPNPSTYDGK